jgi:hypothetical protein
MSLSARNMFNDNRKNDQPVSYIPLVNVHCAFDQTFISDLFSGEVNATNNCGLYSKNVTAYADYESAVHAGRQRLDRYCKSQATLKQKHEIPSINPIEYLIQALPRFIEWIELAENNVNELLAENVILIMKVDMPPNKIKKLLADVHDHKKPTDAFAKSITSIQDYVSQKTYLREDKKSGPTPH